MILAFLQERGDVWVIPVGPAGGCSGRRASPAFLRLCPEALCATDVMGWDGDGQGIPATARARRAPGYCCMICLIRAIASSSSCAGPMPVVTRVDGLAPDVLGIDRARLPFMFLYPDDVRICCCSPMEPSARHPVTLRKIGSTVEQRTLVRRVCMEARYARRAEQAMVDIGPSKLQPTRLPAVALRG